MPNIFTLKFKWTREMKEKSSDREQMEEINDLTWNVQFQSSSTERSNLKLSQNYQ